MKLPDHLRANGNGLASEGAAVSFVAFPELQIVLRDYMGTHQEPITNPETAEWIANVLNAAIQWGHARTDYSITRKAETSRELLKALSAKQV